MDDVVVTLEQRDRVCEISLDRFSIFHSLGFPILILSWVDIAPATLRLPGICFCPQESLSISPFLVFLNLGLFARGDGQLDMVYN